MNYADIVQSLRDASVCSFVKTWVENINMVSSYHDLKYGVVAMDPGLIVIDSGYMIANISLFYIDRRFTETSESGYARQEDNSVSVQSRGIDVLHMIVKRLDVLKFGLVSEQYDVFTQQYLDDCAGARVDLTLKVPYTYCEDNWLV